MSAVEPEGQRQRRTATPSAALAAALLGLQDVLEGRKEREKPVIEVEAAGEPPPDGIEMFLDPEHPERSVVVIHGTGIAHAEPAGPTEVGGDGRAETSS
ncbi:MAG: hypothetical protein ABW073_10530 [Acidimicrobiia bacterium]